MMSRELQKECGEQAKLGALREYVESLQETHPTIGGCRQLSGEVSTWCRERFGADNVAVVQGRFNRDNGVAEHFYVEVDYGDQTWIVDPTVQQFTYHNWVRRKADTYIPESTIPDIGVIGQSMDVFERYE